MKIVRQMLLFMLVFASLCAFKCISSDLEAVSSAEQIVCNLYDGSNYYIYLFNYDGSNPTYLGACDGSGVCVNHSGTKIFYKVGTASPFSLMSMDLKGNNITLVGQTTQNFDSLSISHDDTKIICSHSSSATITSYVFNTNGSGSPVELFSNNHLSLTYSPYADKIAYVKYSGTYSLCISNTDGSNEKVLIASLGGSLQNLSWHPNGSKIIFTYVSGSYNMVEVKIKSSEVKYIYVSPTYMQHALYSPDGYKILYTSGDMIKLMNADGSSPRVLADLSSSSMYINFCPCYTGKSN